MEFTVTKKEVMRRKAAYATLVISLLGGLFLFSILLNTPLMPILYIAFYTAFFLLGAISYRFLNLLARMKIRVSDFEIERLNGNRSETYLLSEIEAIKIKRRSSGDIREIYIFFRNRKNLYISAFEQDFEYLTDILLKKIDKSIPVCEKREPIQFDHVLFYPTLGLIISFCFVCFFKAMIQIDHNVLKYYELGISITACSMAVLFAYGKPNAKRAGKNNAAIDYFIAAAMLILSIYIFKIGINL